MKKHFLISTALAAVLCAAHPAVAQYERYYKSNSDSGSPVSGMSDKSEDGDAAPAEDTGAAPALPGSDAAADEPVLKPGTHIMTGSEAQAADAAEQRASKAAPAPVAPAPEPAAPPAAESKAATETRAARAEPETPPSPPPADAPDKTASTPATDTPSTDTPAAETPAPSYPTPAPAAEAKPEPEAAPVPEPAAAKAEPAPEAKPDVAAAPRLTSPSTGPAQQNIERAPAAPAASADALVSRPPEMSPAVLPQFFPRQSAATPPATSPATQSPPPVAAAPVAPAVPAPPAVAPMTETPSGATPPAPQASTPAAAPDKPADAAASAATTPAENTAAPDTAAPVVPSLADLTLVFSGDASDLSPENQRKLSNLVAQLRDMTSGHLQVRGYASGSNGSNAKRIALSRVLAVRSYFLDKKVDPKRIDVKVMGSETDRSPVDRVDMLFEQ